MIRIGAQLYTVRKLLGTAEETRQTIAAIKEIGYDSVQLFGSVELADCCAGCCQDTGIEIAGILTDLNTCEKNAEALFTLCAKYRIPDLGVSTGFSECLDLDGYIRRINAFAARAKKAGLSFSYHNHGHEFIRLPQGETAMSCFLKGFDANVDLMPDTYWLHDGGCDVRYFLEQTKNRVNILHLKDMKRTEQGHTFAELGSGNLYFAGILKTALACGTEHFVVEQDICGGSPLDSLAQSYRYIKTILEECIWKDSV